MFLVYRQQVRQQREDRKYWEDRLASIGERDRETIDENTKVLTELVTLIKRLNGKA